MFSSLRLAWKRYLASIPAPDEPELIPDGRIIREDFRPPPVDPRIKEAFSTLADLLTAHLPDSVASTTRRKLLALLKPGVDPQAAIARWAEKLADPRSTPIGLIAVDWKAREEVQWQASRLLLAHGVPTEWSYSADSDVDWVDWHNRGLAPVRSPLQKLDAALCHHGHRLLMIEDGDLVVAFAIPVKNEAQVRELCQVAGIGLASEA